MATATVLFVMRAGGDLASKLPSMSAQVQKLGQAALATKAAVVSMASSARSGFNDAAEGAKNAGEGAAKAGAAFAIAGLAVHTLLKDQQDYQQASARLISTVKDLGKTISEALGPSVADFLDRFTVGLSYIGTLATGVIGPAFTVLAQLFGKFSERVVESLKAWKMIMTGDFSGAADVLAGHANAMQEIVDIAKSGFAEIGEVQRKAFDAAFATWKKQVDGVSDLVGKAGQSYADVVQPISGLRPGPGGAFSTDVPMGQVVGSGFTGINQGGGVGALEDINLTQQQEFGLLNDTASAIESGIGGVLGMIPVFGGFLEGIWGFLKDFGGISMNIVDELIGFVTGLADQFETIIVDVPVKLIDAMPDMIASIVALIPRIILDIIASGPRIFAAIVQAIIELPATIGREFVAAFEQLALDIKEALNFVPGSKNTQENAAGQVAGLTSSAHGANMAAIQEMAEQASRRAPRALGGGLVAQPGLAMVHRGEVIQRANDVRRGAAGGTQISIGTIVMQGVQDMDGFIREMRKRFGPYGVGLTLDPLRGG